MLSFLTPPHYTPGGLDFQYCLSISHIPFPEKQIPGGFRKAGEPPGQENKTLNDYIPVFIRHHGQCDHQVNERHGEGYTCPEEDEIEGADDGLFRVKAMCSAKPPAGEGETYVFLPVDRDLAFDGVLGIPVPKALNLRGKAKMLLEFRKSRSASIPDGHVKSRQRLDQDLRVFYKVHAVTLNHCAICVIISWRKRLN